MSERDRPLPVNPTPASERQLVESLRDERREKHGFDEREVSSGSMAPMIDVGDSVRVEHTRAPRVGDIVLIARGDERIVHRLIAHAGREFVEKGDTNAHATTVATEEIAYVVTRVHKREKMLSPQRSFQRPWQRILAFLSHRHWSFAGRMSAPDRERTLPRSARWTAKVQSVVTQSYIACCARRPPSSQMDGQER